MRKGGVFMSKLIIPVGVPGSGKSTLAATIPGAIVLSSDNIREELFGDANLQYTEEYAAKKIKQKKIDTSDLSDEKLLALKIHLCNASVFGTLNYRVKKALKEGKDVVYDATNISAKTRKGILKLLVFMIALKLIFLIFLLKLLLNEITKEIEWFLLRLLKECLKI